MLWKWISMISFCEISFQLFIQGYRSSNDASNVKYVHVIFMNHLGKFFYKIWDRFITVRKQIDRVVLTEVWTIGNQLFDVSPTFWLFLIDSQNHFVHLRPIRTQNRSHFIQRPFCTQETNSCLVIIIINHLINIVVLQRKKCHDFFFFNSLKFSARLFNWL